MKSRNVPTGASVLVLAASIVGIFIFLQTQILSRAKAYLNPVIDYSHISFLIFDIPLAVKFENLKMKTGKPWLAAEKAEILLSFSDLIRGRIKPRQMDLFKPDIKLEKDSSGMINSELSLFVPRVIIHEGAVELSDRINELEPPVAVRFKDVNATVEEDPDATTVHMRGAAVTARGEGEEPLPVAFEAEYAPRQDLLGIRLKLGKDEEIEFEGESVAFTSEMGFRGKLSVQKLRLEEWVSGFGKGTVTGEFDIGGKGIYPENLKRYLGIDGYVDIRDGELKDINFVKNILEQMLPVKGLESIFDEPVPEEFEGLIKNPDMPFSYMKTNVRYSRGRFFVEEFVLQHPDFTIQADGSSSTVERDVDFRAKLVIMPKFSEYLTRRGRSLLLIQNKEGRLIVPFLYRGLMPGAMIYPDFSLLTNVTSDIVVDDLKTKKEYMRS